MLRRKFAQIEQIHSTFNARWPPSMEFLPVEWLAMTRKHFLCCTFAGMIGLFVAQSWQAAHAQSPGPPPAFATAGHADIPQPEVLEQGPIHEAFAELLSLDPPTPLVVTKRPPPPINELPPDQRPAGNNIQWIPGYWAFQEEVDNFVWVSGLWRDAPPGREWIPGEWQETKGGFVWSPGYWTEKGSREIRYLATPPESLEQGPSSPAPGENYLWTPGCWRYANGKYYWQPGFWYETLQNWIWVPNHYCYTSRGSVYVSGYWDYPFAQRGLLYAPVFWRAGYGGWYVRAQYRPRSIVNTGLLIASLLVHGHHNHYYYGYGMGPTPRWLYGRGPAGHNRWGYYGDSHAKRFDPLWAHYHGHNHVGKNDNGRRNGSGHNRGKDHLAGHGPGQRGVLSSIDQLDRQQREALKLRHLSTNEVAQFKHRAGVDRKLARIQVGKRERGAGRIAYDSNRRAWSSAIARNKVVGIVAGDKHNTDVRLHDKHPRNNAGRTQKSTTRARLRTGGSAREQSVRTQPGATKNRGPGQMEVSKRMSQPFHQPWILQDHGGKHSPGHKAIGHKTPSPGAQSARPQAQHRVLKSPSRGREKFYHQPRSVHGQKSVEHHFHVKSRIKSSSRSVRHSAGKSGNRRAGRERKGGKGHSRHGRQAEGR